MIRIDRLIMVQAIAISSAMVAGVIGGLLERSWIWAIACAIFVYAGFRVAAMVWMSHMIRTHPGWRALHDSAHDDDGVGAFGRTVHGDAAGDSAWYPSQDQDDYGSGYGGWTEDLARRLGSSDPGQRAIESGSDD
jgi:hypothetical protein